MKTKAIKYTYYEPQFRERNYFYPPKYIWLSNLGYKTLKEAKEFIKTSEKGFKRRIVKIEINRKETCL